MACVPFVENRALSAPRRDASPGVRLAAAAPSAGPVVTGLTTNLADYPNSQVPRYEKFEVTLTLGSSYPNPFDPDVIRVDGYFTSPGGGALVQPGFYYQPYQVTTVNGAETYTPSGNPAWKVRFSPRETGIYQYYIRLTDASGSTNTSTASFQVTASSNPGFISVSAKNSRYFEFDSGAPFIGLGLNVGWWQFENRRISTYNYYLSRMQEYKANLARVWMVNSARNQDWIMSIQDQSLGSDYNLEEAWAFDNILDLAHQKGVYFLLTLDDVNQYTSPTGRTTSTTALTAVRAATAARSLPARRPGVTRSAFSAISSPAGVTAPTSCPGSCSMRSTSCSGRTRVTGTGRR